MTLTERLLTLLPEVRRDLGQPERWLHLAVTYELPHVDRLWRQYGEHRILLHRIHALPFGAEAMWHPHEWPSAVLIVRGGYHMSIAGTRLREVQEIVEGDSEPITSYKQVRDRVLADVELVAGSSYEMTNRDAWHVVRPQELTWSVMLTGPRWSNAVPFDKPRNPGPRLSNDHPDVLALLDEWRWWADLDEWA